MDEDDLRLHDAQLRSLSLDWKRGEVRIAISAWNQIAIQITAHGAVFIEAPRHEPWGRSDHILCASFTGDEDPFGLDITMQSGDVIRLGADDFSITCTRISNRPLSADPRDIPIGTDGG
ncbi:hypothetical protein [Herbiconiux sp.]|uniref:hypothetical protein n=1 Tax=Herbiconiux sp. TaxID=1871186 RepID=UPI0025C181DD|nr:hypothetical protein [Herbiconiux sp.]